MSSDHTRSWLMELPTELRLQIYNYHFAAVRLSYGVRLPNTASGFPKNVRPDVSALSLLTTCKQIHEETSNIWLELILFSYEHALDLLDHLVTVQAALVARIRHVRVRGATIYLRPRKGERMKHWTLGWALTLLPDLKLDILTVVYDTTYQDRDAYRTMSDLVLRCHNFRRLCFLTSDSNMLSFAKAPIAKRRPQPASWQQSLTDCNGVDSGASVVIYRSNEQYNSYLDPGTWDIFVQELGSSDDDRSFGDLEDEYLSLADQMEKKLMVIVDRGRKSWLSKEELAQADVDPDTAWTKNLSWGEIRAMAYTEECERAAGRKYPWHELQDLFDRYHHANDIEWNEYDPFSDWGSEAEEMTKLWLEAKARKAQTSTLAET